MNGGLQQISKVVIGEGTDRLQVTFDALVNADLTITDLVKPILIKPNFINPSHSDMGMTTDVKVVEAIVKYLTEMGRKDVIIAEGNGCGQADKAFEINGYYEMAKRYDVKCINLDTTEMIQMPILPNEDLLFSKFAFDYQVISVAKLKPHTLAGATLTMKNLMGFVYPKGNMHGNLHNKIVNLYRSVKPIFGVVDGFVANARAEQENAPIPMDCVIVGNNLVDVDIVCSKIMGIDYVGHLEIAKREGLSSNDLLTIGGVESLNTKYNRLKTNGI